MGRAVGLACLLALLVAGCGAGSRSRTTTPASVAALIREARPIGRGARFQPPVRGTVQGRCSARIGRRSGVHVELFADNRVIVVAGGIGLHGPVHRSEGRVTAAGCYGNPVTLEPTGVVLVRSGRPVRMAALFRAWGQTLSARQLTSFPGRVRVYIAGRRRAAAPGAVPLTRHAEIVLEVGPYVPPHTAYNFPPGS